VRGLPWDVPGRSTRAHARPRCNDRRADGDRVIAVASVVSVASVARGRDTGGPRAVMSLADNQGARAAAGTRARSSQDGR
jgi:hypothetical protein